MLNIQEAIRSLIQEELNKNTQGLDFEVSLYNVKTNDLLENTLPVGDTYATQQRRFIPVLIEEISGEYADLQNLTASEVFVNLSLLIPVDHQDFNNIVIEETYQKVALALDELRIRTNARKLPLGNKQIEKSVDYRLKILNNTNMLSTDFIGFNLKLLEDKNGVIATDDDTFLLSYVDGDLVFQKDGLTATWTNDDSSIETNTDYRINIFKSGNTLLVSVFGGGKSLTANIVNANTVYDNIVFGGLLMSLSNIVLGTNSNALSFSLTDFESYIPNIGEPSDLEVSGVGTQYSTGVLGSIVFGYSIPNPTTNQFTMGNGLNYQQFELNMTGFMTDTVFVGNEVRYFLDNTEIFPFFRDETFVSETDPSQVVGQQITKHTAVQSVLGREYSIYYKNETKLTELAKKITSETPNPNEVFKFRVEYPFFVREYDVIITQGSLGISNNQPISISVKFDLASNILLEDFTIPTPTPTPPPVTTPIPTPTPPPVTTPTPIPTPTPTPTPPILTSPTLNPNITPNPDPDINTVSFSFKNQDEETSVRISYLIKGPNYNENSDENQAGSSGWITPFDIYQPNAAGSLITAGTSQFGIILGVPPSLAPNTEYTLYYAATDTLQPFDPGFRGNSLTQEVNFTTLQDPNPTINPTINIVSVTENGLSFNFTNNEPNLDISVFYTFDENVSQTIPSAPGSGWISFGNVPANQSSFTLGVSDLDPGEEYVIYYVARASNKNLSEVLTEEFTTSGTPLPTPTPTFNLTFKSEPLNKGPITVTYKQQEFVVENELNIEVDQGDSITAVAAETDGDFVFVSWNKDFVPNAITTTNQTLILNNVQESAIYIVEYFDFSTPTPTPPPPTPTPPPPTPTPTPPPPTPTPTPPPPTPTPTPPPPTPTPPPPTPTFFTATSQVVRASAGNWFVPVPVQWESTAGGVSGTTTINVNSNTQLTNAIPENGDFAIIAPDSVNFDGETYTFIRWRLNSVDQSSGEQFLEILDVQQNLFLEAVFEQFGLGGGF